MVNAVTIDVEDYFHVSTFSDQIPESAWNSYPSRVVDSTLSILDLLDEFSIKATFFILGWVGNKHPVLIKDIKKRGHEIASHGFSHQLVYNMTPETFRDDVRRSKKILEDVSGDKVIGFRAPSYSITRKSLWAMDVLAGEGFLYDSSIFPIIHDIYGIPDAQRFPHDIRLSSGNIKEFPISTFELSLLGIKYRIPIGGGGYLRLLPCSIINKAISFINSKEAQPAVLYFHPWEIDTKQPRIKADAISSFRHYFNLNRTVLKLRAILCSHEFTCMKTVLGIT